LTVLAPCLPQNQGYNFARTRKYRRVRSFLQSSLRDRCVSPDVRKMFVDDPRLAVLIQNEYLRSATVADGLVRGGHHRGLKHAGCIPAKGVGGHGDVVCQDVHFDGPVISARKPCLRRKVLCSFRAAERRPGSGYVMSQWKKKEQLSVTRCHCLVAGGTRRSVAPDENVPKSTSSSALLW